MTPINGDTWKKEKLKQVGVIQLASNVLTVRIQRVREGSLLSGADG